MRPIGSDDSAVARTPTAGTPLGNLLMPGLSGMATRPHGAGSRGGKGGPDLAELILQLLQIRAARGEPMPFDPTMLIPMLRRLQAVRAAGSPF